MSPIYDEHITLYTIDNCNNLTQTDYFNFMYIFTFLFYILGTALISISMRYNHLQNRIHLLANNKKIGKYLAEYIYGDEDECIIEELDNYSVSETESDDDNEDLDFDPDKDSDNSNHYSDNDTKIKTPSYIFDNIFY